MQSKAKTVIAFLKEVPTERKEALHRLVQASRAYGRDEEAQGSVESKRREFRKGLYPLLQTRTD